MIALLVTFALIATAAMSGCLAFVLGAAHAHRHEAHAQRRADLADERAERIMGALMARAEAKEGGTGA